MAWNPPDPETYNALVWAIVRQIPAGKISSYGQIASMIPPPDGVQPQEYDRLGSRWVGQAMRDTPDGEHIPWQRVINSQGKISLPEEAGGLKQRALLEAEGITFSEAGTVNFTIVGWDGPGDDWLRERGLLPPKPLGKRKKDSGQPKLF